MSAPLPTITALVDGEFAMSGEERLRQSVSSPGSRGTVSIPRANNVSLARIRYNLQAFSHDTYEEAVAAWREVAKNNPARALELWIELAQFSLPKLKAVAVLQTSNADDPSLKGFADLLRSVTDAKIISDQ